MKQAGPLLHDATTWRRRRCSLPRDDLAGRAPPRRLYTKFRWSGSLMRQSRLPALEWSKARLPPRREAQEPTPRLRFACQAPLLMRVPRRRKAKAEAPYCLPALDRSQAHLPPRRKAQEPHPHLRLRLLAPRLRPLPHARGTPEWAPVAHPQLRVAGTVRARHRLAEDLHIRSWCPAPLSL